MPALMIPSSSNSSVSSSYKSNPVPTTHTTKTLNAPPHLHNFFPSSYSSSSISLTNSQTARSTTSSGGGPLRIDTRQVALNQLQETRRLNQTPSKNGSTSVSSSDIKSSISSPVSVKDSMEVIQRKLKQNLVRCTQNGDRRLLCRTLQNCAFLQNIPVTRVPSSPNTYPPIDQLEKLASSRPIEFNEMILGGGNQEINGIANTNTTSNATRNKVPLIARKRGWNDTTEIPIIVREVCSRLARHSKSSNGLTEDELYHAVMVRLSKVQSSQDSHSMLTSLLANPPELNVHVPKKPWKPLAQTQIWLYVSDGEFHCVCKTYHGFGLFRKSDPVNRPWIGLTAAVHERVNLSTGSSYERISLQVHEDKYAIV